MWLGPKWKDGFLISGSYSFHAEEDFVILANKPRFVLKARFKIDKILLKPLFHHSIIPYIIFGVKSGLNNIYPFITVSLL